MLGGHGWRIVREGQPQWVTPQAFSQQSSRASHGGARGNFPRQINVLRQPGDAPASQTCKEASSRHRTDAKTTHRAAFGRSLPPLTFAAASPAPTCVCVFGQSCETFAHPSTLRSTSEQRHDSDRRVRCSVQRGDAATPYLFWLVAGVRACAATTVRHGPRAVSRLGHTDDRFSTGC
jgi:hypothetical protein